MNLFILQANAVNIALLRWENVHACKRIWMRDIIMNKQLFNKHEERPWATVNVNTVTII